MRRLEFSEVFEPLAEEVVLEEVVAAGLDSFAAGLAFLGLEDFAAGACAAAGFSVSAGDGLAGALVLAAAFFLEGAFAAGLAGFFGAAGFSDFVLAFGVLLLFCVTSFSAFWEDFAGVESSAVCLAWREGVLGKDFADDMG